MKPLRPHFNPSIYISSATEGACRNLISHKLGYPEYVQFIQNPDWQLGQEARSIEDDIDDMLMGTNEQYSP